MDRVRNNTQEKRRNISGLECPDKISRPIGDRSWLHRGISRDLTVHAVHAKLCNALRGDELDQRQFLSYFFRNRHFLMDS